MKRELDNIRKEFGDKDNMEIIKDPFKKAKFFVLYINKRIENLLKKEVCKNANIVEGYYKLNGVMSKEVKENIKLEIRDWKDKTEYQDINVLEVAFQHKLKSEYIEDYKLFSLLDIEPSSLFSQHLGSKQNTRADIIKAFAKLEAINKKVTAYYKVHGYLKDRRLEQQYGAKYNVMTLEEIKLMPTQHISSTRYMDPNASVKYMVKGEIVSKDEHDKYYDTQS